MSNINQVTNKGQVIKKKKDPQYLINLLERIQQVLFDDEQIYSLAMQVSLCPYFIMVKLWCKQKPDEARSLISKLMMIQAKQFEDKNKQKNKIIDFNSLNQLKCNFLNQEKINQLIKNRQNKQVPNINNNWKISLRVNKSNFEQNSLSPTLIRKQKTNVQSKKYQKRLNNAGITSHPAQSSSLNGSSGAWWTNNIFNYLKSFFIQQVHSPVQFTGQNGVGTNGVKKDLKSLQHKSLQNNSSQNNNNFYLNNDFQRQPLIHLQECLQINEQYIKKQIILKSPLINDKLKNTLKKVI